MYRKYDLDLVFNDTSFGEIWIDPHYETKHSGSINDLLILEILRSINDTQIEPNARITGFQFYELDALFKEKSYRLILVVPISLTYLGVRNAYRRRI